MKPIYFPLTYISEQSVEALASCFEQIALYQPCSRNIPETLQKWAEKRVLDIRVPAKQDNDRLERVIKEYKAWAELHKGSELAFFKSRKDAVPFFDENSPSQIRSELKSELKKDMQGPAEKEKTDPLFNARLFLCMAQDSDIRNLEVSQHITSFETKEQDMMNALKGGDDFDIAEFETPKTENSLPREDPGIYMTAERIEAWFHLMQHDPEKSALFVTDSRAVFDYLTEKNPAAETVLCLERIPFCKDRSDEKFQSWQDNLKKYLDKLAGNGSTDTAVVPPAQGNRNFSLTFCVVPEKTPSEVFGQCVESRYVRDEMEQSTGKYKNTVIGLIEGSG